MDPKIAIVTTWRSDNRGSILQAYALQRILALRGYDSEFIDFSPRREGYLYRLARLARDLLKDTYAFTCRPDLYENRNKNRRFVRDKLRVGPFYATYDQLSDRAEGRYSAAICGSDQIWKCPGGYAAPLYYLTFIDTSKRIAYAPSIGCDCIPPNCTDSFREYVNQIPFLSVREEQGAVLIKEIVGRDAEVVLDPSLLLTGEQWRTDYQVIESACLEDGYILCYFLRDNPEYTECAYRLSELTGHDLVAIEPVSRKDYASLRDMEIVAAGPLELVQLIDNASYVLTDSFHGVAFSINLEKQFATFKRFGDDDPISENSRVYSILGKTRLESRLIAPSTMPGVLVEKHIEYDLVRPLLDLEREQSLAYLQRAVTAVVGY
jgi:hypothetical protein